MESDEIINSSSKSVEVGADSLSAVNSLILDYYKKFGRKRDLEQFFSLSTAQSDIKDPTSPFWRKMKNENDSSDSEGRKSSSSREICRISIKCSVPESYSSQDEDQSKTKDESVSPPIIIEGVPTNTSQHTDEDSLKSDDNQSHRSFDALLLDTSTQKPFSPTSSVTSQRKLEWDSLADVGYGNETDRKTSASSLSTLERLALKQQYSNNDTKENIGPPTSHSTPLDENDKLKCKKGVGKKTTKIYQKDVDIVEVNVPSTSDVKPNQSINVNLTKHICFNVEKDGGVSINNIKRDISVSPEKQPAENVGNTSNVGDVKSDKEIQTSLIKTKEKSTTSVNSPKAIDLNVQKTPIMISVNTLRKRLRRKKSKTIKKRMRPKKKLIEKNIPTQEKSGGPLSEAESFEYMPGHIYNQNQIKNLDERHVNTSAGNKSSLESSGAMTTDSSKSAKNSFTKDLEKGIDLLKKTLQKRFDDSEVKNKLIKEIVSRLIKSKYRDDDSGEYLSGLTFSSSKLGLHRSNHTTTSTSDGNVTENNTKKPRKSILRVDKFNSNAVASSSQSAPNLLTAASSNKAIASNLSRPVISNTESDVSSQGKNSPKTSSEELYQKYLAALKREQAYKRHLRDKEYFLKQKLASSDSALKVPKVSQEVRVQNRIKDLMKDLTRNNYDDGSGDASKLEVSSNVSFGRLRATQNQRSHSVFTLSSSQSDCPKKPNLKKKYCDIKDITEAGPSSHYCCCPHHHTNAKVGYVDSSVQVNIKCQYDEIDPHTSNKYSSSPSHTNKCKEFPRNRGQPIAGNTAGDIDYVCVCNEYPVKFKGIADSSMLYQCSGLRRNETGSQISDIAVQCGNSSKPKNDNIQLIRPPCPVMDNESSGSEIPCGKKQSKSSQTNLLLKMMYQELSDTNTCFSDSKTSKDNRPISLRGAQSSVCSGKNYVHEATRSLQTEISINPKITDPSLGDINIVNDCECAKFISEQYREVIQSGSSKTNSSQKSDVCMQGSARSRFGKNSLKCEDMLRNNNIDDKDLDKHNKLTTHTKEEFTIPIRGTNMTLMVNLGKVEAIVPKQVNVDQGCITDNANIDEQATCVSEECSKAIQCGSPDFVEQIDVNRNKISKETGTSNEIQTKNIAISCDAAGKCSTFPKNTKVNTHKPLCRSNTDTDRVEKIRFMVPGISNESCSPQRASYSEVPLEQGAHNVDDNTQSKCEPEVIKSPRCDCGSKITVDHCCRKKDIGIQKYSPPCSPTRTEKGYGSCSPKRNKEVYSRSCSPKRTKESYSASTDTKIVEEERKSSKISPISPRRSGNEKRKDCSSNTCNSGVNTELRKSPQACNCGSDNSSKSCNEDKSCGIKYTKRTVSCKANSESENSTNANYSDAKGDCCNLKQYKSTRKETCGSEKSNSPCYGPESQKEPQILIKHKTNQKTCCTEKSQKNCCVRHDSKKEATALCPRVAEESSKGSSDRKDKEFVSTCTETIQPSSSNDCERNTGVKPTYCSDQPKDPILDMIREITKVYTKADVEKYKRKKCYKEIMTVLHYLLETDESDGGNANACTTPANDSQENIQDCSNAKGPERSIQISPSKCKDSDAKISIESSDIQASSDLPFTSSDSAACKVLNKIKKECEKYHQKRCRSGRKCYSSSTTSVNCDQCKKVHYCLCKSHKCRKSKGAEKFQKKCIAYNLIIQTSESVLSQENSCDTKSKPLKNIVVKVPKSKPVQNICKETTCKKETVYKKEKPRSPRCGHRSRSCPNESEVSSAEEILKKTQQCTVRQYLERNRPDFVENCTQRQSCLKFVSDVRANERNARRDLLSMHVERQPDLTALSSDELRQLATEIGLDLRRKRPAPKFISEREMKKHSENIYKTLPEVVQKKEEQKKQNIKKTNLLMANIFKKNLQKKTLRGSVNLSNYSAVIKI